MSNEDKKPRNALKSLARLVEKPAPEPTPPVPPEGTELRTCRFAVFKQAAGPGAHINLSASDRFQMQVHQHGVLVNDSATKDSWFVPWSNVCWFR